MKIKKNAPFSKFEKARHSWPFTEMDVNDVIDIAKETEFKRASKAAHTFAGSKDPKWKFATRWSMKDGIGRIRRVK